MRVAAVILLLAMFSSLAVAKKVKTTRGKLRLPEVKIEEAVDSMPHAQILVPCDSDFIFAGFDKPLSSLNETVFVTNNTLCNVAALYLTIEYIDRAGRQLHSRSLRVDAAVPAGSTRILKFPSWDRQKSFYYIKSRKPRTLATPFSVTCRIDSVEVVHSVR